MEAKRGWCCFLVWLYVAGCSALCAIVAAILVAREPRLGTVILVLAGFVVALVGALELRASR
jgi:hypothetical protein